MTNLSVEVVWHLPTCCDKPHFSEMLSPPPSPRHSGELQWKALTKNKNKRCIRQFDCCQTFTTVTSSVCSYETLWEYLIFMLCSQIKPKIKFFFVRLESDFLAFVLYKIHLLCHRNVSFLWKHPEKFYHFTALVVPCLCRMVQNTGYGKKYLQIFHGYLTVW